MTHPSKYAPSTMANYTSTLPSCPKHWTPAQDSALKNAYQALTTSSTITTFKHSIAKTILSSLPSHSILTNIRFPHPNAANITSYDLNFLSYRIKHLLGPSASTTGFLSLWSRIPRSLTTRACYKGCSGRSRIWQNLSTGAYRCGGCGRTDLTILPPSPSSIATKTLVSIVPILTNARPNTPFPGVPSSLTTAHEVDTPIPAPANWSVAHTRHLKESYLVQQRQHACFSVTNFQFELGVFFSSTAVDAEIATLPIDTSAYGLCFIHCQLEEMFGVCACRGMEMSMTRKRRCYLHPYVKAEVSNEGKVVACGKCTSDMGVVYAIPVNEAGEMGGRYEGFRCGLCGDGDVKEIEVLDEG